VTLQSANQKHTCLTKSFAIGKSLRVDGSKYTTLRSFLLVIGFGLYFLAFYFIFCFKIKGYLDLSFAFMSSSTMAPPRKRKRSAIPEVPIRITAAAPAAAPAPAPTTVALPPPLMPYHPHLMPSYYPVYHQHPYFLSVGQPPISPSLSPTLPSNATEGAAPTSPSTSSDPPNTQRILPKSPQPAGSPSLAPSFNYYPYPMQVSPQLHPTATSSTSRHNSTSSQSGTTADQREQARKVSHSAIERRRRERINDKIFQLKELIPSCSDRDNLHKMTILQSAIDYITYLKKVIEDLEGSETTGNQSTRSEKDQEFIDQVQSLKLQQQQQTKSSMLPKEVEPFTHQFTITPPADATPPPRINTSKGIQQGEAVVEELEEEEEDAWSASSGCSPSTKKTTDLPITPLPSLKPMDIIKSSKKSVNTTEPPAIVVVNGSQENSPTSSAANSIDRNMNLENILC
jgi:hypothetical protein